MTNAGDTVGGYQLVRSLGEGPFGAVWQAQDVRGAPLAVKLLRPGFVQQPAGRAAFTRLVAALRAQELIQHDSIARVYGSVEDSEAGAYGMACEFVDGRLVSDIRMPSAGEQDAKAISVVLAWFESLGEVLAWLHSQGIVHGNLKPTNVKLVREAYGHRIKLLDLPWSSIGLAAPADGAPSYLAPEQLNGAPPSGYSDQWSLAKMLADIVTAGRPGGLSQLPAGLSMVIQRANHPNPGYRFSQMLELVAALRGVRGELARPPGGAYTPYGPYVGAGYGAGPLGSMPGVGHPMGGMPYGADASIPGVGVPNVHFGPVQSVPPVQPVPPLNPNYPPQAPVAGSSVPGSPVAGSRSGSLESVDDADPVFVPTARSLGTDANGGVLETGEHEALRFVVDPMPEPVVTSLDEERAPLGGAPALSRAATRPLPQQPAQSAEPREQGGQPSAGGSHAQFGVPTIPSQRAPGWPAADNDAANVANKGQQSSPQQSSPQQSSPQQSSPQQSSPQQSSPQRKALQKNGQTMEAPVDPDDGPGLPPEPSLSDSASGDVVPRADTVLLTGDQEPIDSSGGRAWTWLLALAAVMAIVAGAFLFLQKDSTIPLLKAPKERAEEVTAKAAGVSSAVEASEPSEATDPGAATDTGIAAKEATPSAQRTPPPERTPSRRTRPGSSAPVAKRGGERSSAPANPDGPLGPDRQPSRRAAAPTASVEPPPDDEPEESAPAADDDAPSEIEDAQVGCDEGNGGSCVRVARFQRDAGDSAAALAAAQRACTFNSAMGCVLAADLAGDDRTVARRVLRKGCRLRSAMACHRASLVARNAKEKAEMAKTACQLGRKDSCVKAAATSSASVDELDLRVP